ncbi:MAG TPA: N-6 DNA methylase [Candidatus Nitrosotalea sp.]|nr:N-6 DNA methylase [Candidatus Nitrosotalea sp.]
MSELEKGPKLQQLENFLTKPDSDESKNYTNDLLFGGTARPEYLFVQKFLSVDFWREMGFSDHEIQIESPAGVGGRVEITLAFDDQKIAIECKKPYVIQNGQTIVHKLQGADQVELKEQILPYLLSHSFIIFTNGFHWFFYSRESYRAWLLAQKKKDDTIKPYFQYLNSQEIFDKESPNFILNFLARETIQNSLSGFEYESVRHVLTDEFFSDLKIWIKLVDIAFKKATDKGKIRTTSLINKLIFVRTMEDVGIIPNGFLSSIWNNKKGVKTSTVDLIDHIDDELSEIYDTELFTPKYVVDEDGNPILKKGVPEYSQERANNFAYSALSEGFFDALFHPIEPTNLTDTGISKFVIDGNEFFVRSLYWWRFGSISGDILGKAYETYLAQERKKLGIYYTPHQITEYLTQKTVSTVFDEKLIELKSELVKKNWDISKIKSIADRIKDIKICDPSCGSGSFLIQAMRVVWKKYREIEEIVRAQEREVQQGKAVLDQYYTDRVSIVTYLKVLFRTSDKRERIGTLILRHIFGNDKDENAIDTAKLNIWLECLRLDPNSFRKDGLKNKRHVLPNLELNLTVGDSLIGFDTENVAKSLSRHVDTLKSIYNITAKYSEEFAKTSLAKAVVDLKKSLQGLLNYDFSQHLGTDYIIDMLKILEPTHWALQHLDAYYDTNGQLKRSGEQGFDVIIGNPPWEILKPNVNEFFGMLYNSEDLAKFSLLTKDKKNKIVSDLLKSPSNQLDWNHYQKSIQLQQEYFQRSEFYKHQSGEIDGEKTGGDINLYKLFIEKYFDLLREDGLCGVVLPANFYSDLASKGLRELIFYNAKILSLFGFDNKNAIFEEVHRQFKFITLVFRKGEESKFFKAAFYVRDVNKISFLERDSIDYDLDLIKTTSPKSLSLIECGTKQEVDIVKKLYVFPTLEKDSNWKMAFTNEFHMTKHAPLFNTQGKGRILYEGKMIHQFIHNLSEPRYWIEEKKATDNLILREQKRIKSIIKKLENPKDDITTPKIRLDCEEYRIAWRNISRSTDQRTMICTILPPYGFLGNSLNYIKPLFFDGRSYLPSLTFKETLFLCGMLNSFVVDFVLRHKVSINANMFYVYELPVPRLKEGEKYFDEVIERVGSLICTTEEFADIKRKCGISKVAINTDEREILAAQINALAAKIFDLNEEELEFILSTFPIVEERTKEQVTMEFEKLNS